MAQHQEEFKLVSDNRKAYHDYFILEKIEAGLVLTGTEVKSAREGRVQLREAYADVVNGEAWLMNAHFSPYSHGNIFNHEPTKKRKLLLHRKEIDKITGKALEKGLTLIPLRMYLKHGLLKCEIAICRGKKLHDKREATAEREQEREAQKAMSLRNSRHLNQ